MMAGYYIKETRIKEDATPIDNVTKFAWDDDDYEEVEVWHEYTEEELKQQEEAKAQAQRESNLNAIADLIHTTTEQSDKLGYLWKCTYIGDICVSKEYVQDPDAKGTYNNPIEWEPGVTLIANAYYLHDSKKYVYVGEPSTAGKEWDGVNFEEVDWQLRR